MSNSVLIVERDLELMKELRDALMARGFEVDETTDGKGTPELIRRNRPHCVVLAVDLDAGQNGYIICKKLKSDDDLKSVPVIIIGDPKGFAKHQQLKTRAEDYVGKPLTSDDLVEVVGKLIGFPQVPITDEGFNPDALLEEAANDIYLPPPPLDEAPQSDLVGLDSTFETTSPNRFTAVLEEEVPLTPPELGDPDGYASDKTVVGMSPTSWQPATKQPYQSSPSSIDAAEAREMRAKVAELGSALDESRDRTQELENKIRELENEVEAHKTELETARAAPSKSDAKEVFALRDAANKKDKEVLKLKNELNAKEQEIVELREKENTLEQQLSEMNSEVGSKDSQIKTLQAKVEQGLGDKRKVDQQLTTAKEEARGYSARLQTLQTDYDSLIVRVPELEGQLEEVKANLLDEEARRQTSAFELSSARGEIEAMRSSLDERSGEVEGLNSQVEQLQKELDDTRTQLSTQTTSFAHEVSSLRQRLSESEAETANAENAAARTQTRVNAFQDQFDRLRSQLKLAVDTLGESPTESEDLDIDEIAEA